MSNDNIPDMFDKLEALQAQFNPNPGFGFSGMQANVDPQFAQQQRVAEQQAAATTTAPPPTATPENKDAFDSKLLTDILAPLNDTVQGLKSSFGQMEQRMSAREPHPTETQQPAQTVAADPNLTPEQLQNMKIIENQRKIEVDLAWARAQNALLEARMQYPEANLSEDDLKAVWTKGRMSEHPEIAKNLDWGNHMKLEAKSRSFESISPKFAQMQKDLLALNDQMSSMKTAAAAKPNVADMSALPQTGRRMGASNSATTVTSKGPNGEDVHFNKSVYERTKERMGKHGFVGMNKILNEEATREALMATA